MMRPRTAACRREAAREALVGRQGAAGAAAAAILAAELPGLEASLRIERAASAERTAQLAVAQAEGVRGAAEAEALRVRPEVGSPPDTTHLERGQMTSWHPQGAVWYLSAAQELIREAAR